MEMEIALRSEATRTLVVAWKTDFATRVVGELDLEVLPNGETHIKATRPMVRGMRYWLDKPETIVIVE